MVNETTIVPKRELTPKAWEEIHKAATVAKAARYYDMTPEQVLFVTAKGYELGFPVTAALDFIHPVKNKLSLSPMGALALLHASGKMDSLEIEDKRDDKGNPVSCTVTMKRGNIEYTSTFTIQDAKRAGLIKDDSAWEKYPANLLRWRAMGYCIDVMFPDIASGLYTPEELGADVDENGEPVKNWQVEQPVVTMTQLPEITEKVVIVEAKPEDEILEQVLEQAGEPPEEEKPKAKVPVLSDLIEKHGAQAILEANDGLIPQTDEQLIAVAEKLENGDDAN